MNETIEKYSKFFTFEELTNSENHKELVEQNRKDALKYVNAGKRLSKLLESIRHVLGDNPIKVTSGFRNEALNKAVGSKAKMSSHLRFEAADIIPTSMSVETAFRMLMLQKDNLPDLRKCIIEMNRWLHIEVSMKEGDYIGFLATKDGLTFDKIA